MEPKLSKYIDKIRNFSVIAHIDHGKSTLSDRIIQHTGMVSDRDFKDQLLDSMDLERERGITIKSQTVCLPYTAKNGENYILNLIDTPGHVDFSYEVSRALTSCEGVLLLVDASQGVEAQTLANLYLAMEHDLEIIPVINKIDLPSANIEMVKEQIEEDLGLDSEIAILTSAKEGIGIEDVLEAVVEFIPAPEGDRQKPLKALVFDSHYDAYRGVIVQIRVIDGTLKKGDLVNFMSTGSSYKVEEAGFFRIAMAPQKELQAGDVGYIIAGIKNISDVQIGDTITLKDEPCEKAISGFKEVKPMVFSSLYPVSTDELINLTEALEKLKLNDASLIYEKDNSAALGFGFRCGFLGLLHLEIVQERLEREFDVSLIITAPSVQYKVKTDDEPEEKIIDNPSHYPDPGSIEYVMEPYIKGSIIVPDNYIGAIMKLCMEKRAKEVNHIYLDTKRVEFTVILPLAEVIYDFYDKLKTVTQGYGSFDYEIHDYDKTDLVKLDFLVNAERVDALSQLVHRANAEARGRSAVKRLKDEIPRQMFKIPIQAAIGGNVIARETISAFRKDVTAKCYGGDISRKRKLLEKQKKGKQRMKMVGSVEIPQTAFLSVLKTKDD
ncbi:MAG: translation elongation factor 4 [Desulforegulaceae bacterium]|nr:translation elongation factor 4 [Desulforegulaceae bacterium]